jgi:hypothetical protein
MTIREAVMSVGPRASVWGLSLALTIASTATVVAQTAGREPYQQVDDVVLYLGIIPAAVLRGHMPSHAERSMHGGPTHGGNEYHVTIAPFERDSGKRIQDADVLATVSGLGGIGTVRLRLEPMTIAGVVTYGGFVTFPEGDRYTISVDLRRAGASAPVKAEFTYDRSR